MVTIEDITKAYIDCRKKKRNTINAIRFEIDYECNLARLTDEINDRTYRISRCLSFVVTRPRYREVFAADFRDRIIHHYIALRIIPILDKIMNDRSFNCRAGKGTLSGVKQLYSDIKECSNQYTEDCWVCKMDIKGFFMSINRLMLSERVETLTRKYYQGEDKEDLLWLERITITNSPEYNCTKKSPLEMWKYIPKEKSLFTNGENIGLPIGNLPSQILANYLMDSIDWEIENMGLKYHGRYVDDIYIVDRDKNLILKSIPKIRFLLSEIGLTLHPKKFYLQHYLKGIEFTGTVIKGNRSYVNKRLVFSFKDSVKELELAKTIDEIFHAVSRVNSYLGTMSHHNTYAIRSDVLIHACIYDKVYVGGKYEKVVIKNKYKYREFVRKEINKRKWIEIGLASSVCP